MMPEKNGIFLSQRLTTSDVCRGKTVRQMNSSIFWFYFLSFFFIKVSVYVDVLILIK